MREREEGKKEEEKGGRDVPIFRLIFFKILMILFSLAVLPGEVREKKFSSP